MLEELTQEYRRRDSVLVLRGTGFNIWHYFPFLANFSLQELSQFRAVYTVSGASLLLWLYCLMKQGAISEAVAADYDAVMRRSLNRHGWAWRTAALLSGRYPYSASDFLRVFRGLAPVAARHQTLAQFPLQRIRIVAHELARQQLLVLSPEEFPSFSIDEAISRAVTWDRLFGRPFCHRTPYHGLLIGDFDFAPRRVRDEFRDYLRTQHPGSDIYQINLFHTGERDYGRFVRVCYDRFPRTWQLLDFLCFYFGIPNRRYRATARGTWPL